MDRADMQHMQAMNRETDGFNKRNSPFRFKAERREQRFLDVTKCPPVRARQDHEIPGYLESDNNFVADNLEAAVWLLEQMAKRA